VKPGRGGACLRDAVLEADLLPDAIVRAGIRQILRQRLRQEDERDEVRQRQRADRFVSDLRAGPIAVHTDAANTQHYDVPAEFFEHVLGPQMKYSCGLWSAALTLRDAEEAMLRLTCDRAELADGQRILELGCGWGSLTLHVAERFPGSTIVAVSNSASQRAFIERRAAERGVSNVRVVTADMNDFDAAGSFDRVVSVEMFEHMRNHAALLARIARWLTQDGKLFVHIFTHRRFAYAYDARGASDWMAEHFFTGGMMPSDDLLYRFQDDLRIEAHWRVNGTHYERTSNAWLANMDANRASIDRVLERTYGAADVARWRVRWRIFFMACAELFGFHGGTEWMVSHYRFVTSAAGS
jgi:cyclopropane-fatty-acyl-phospholipid synthase